MGITVNASTLTLFTLTSVENTRYCFNKTGYVVTEIMQVATFLDTLFDCAANVEEELQVHSLSSQMSILSLSSDEVEVGISDNAPGWK